MRFVLPLLLLLLSPVFSGCDGSAPADETQSSPGEMARSSSDSLPAPDPGSLEEVRAAVQPVAPVDAENEDGAAVPSAEASDGEDTGRPLSPEDFPRPERIRGIYLNAWTAGSARRREALIALARRTEINAFVIDIKDASGYVSHDSQVPLAREVGATGEIRIRDLPGLLRRLRDAGIYPIARIVVAKDPVLSKGRSDLAIQDSAGGVWIDQDSVVWLNLQDSRVWDYHIALAREVARAGFPEIQWDYVRFPDAPEELLARAVYPGADGRSKTDAIRSFLGYARERLRPEGVQMTADVFGVTTSYRRDVGIGQLWESLIDQVDVALPMVYPSHYWPGSFGFQSPNAYPYEIVRRALRDAVSRSAAVAGAGSVRPWLQDFSLGEPQYGAPEIRAQIQAAYDAGVEEWVLWNPGSRYTEAALIPKRGLPSWLEPVIRVGGKVVAVSKRFQVLGEEEKAAEASPPDTLGSQTGTLPLVGGKPRGRALPAVPIPDTSRVPSGG